MTSLPSGPTGMYVRSAPVDTTPGRKGSGLSPGLRQLKESAQSAGERAAPSSSAKSLSAAAP